ncbi:basic proline-rich protein-like isoform X1 [Triplophysa dalaica]|uniref:basic proline-rich protein-like isoform X1 n=1 Tax=Triplophysa dalaica TaxID=1582913 RepID=UPI0024DF872B|nr:basic proline-rich protein-like isoform X1 [Triplophysa dalaica]
MASSSNRVSPNDMERNTDQQTEKKKKKGMRANFKKRWRAVKGCCSCTQSNDLDPSEEPYLPVLNPVVLVDTADCPGCDLEQTPLEDPVDPPQDSAGLKQTAPEEPADNTAEQQTEGKKKKTGIRARFKKGWQAMKHSCTPNNKVVPLPTQPDLDPSCPVDPQPASVDPQPASVDPQPAPVDPQPARVARVDPQPARVDPQPARVDPQPARVDPQPARVDPQPARVDPQPARVDPQPARVDPQPARVDPQPARVDPQPARVDPQPASVDPQPARIDPQPARVDPQPARIDPQPARIDPQPAPDDPAEDRPEWKKKKKGVCARFKKGWQAMKHSCTPNNKVVPLPTQPDLDPSYPVDPQPARVDPQPASVDPQPASLDPQPASVDPQPASVDPQPARVDPQPARVDPQPARVDPQPACVDPQPARVDPQPARVDPQPARVDPQPARVDPQPARVDPQPACVDPQPDPQPACVDPQPARVDPQPARVDPQPARVDPQPAPEDQAEDRPEWKKKKKGVRARFKKGWQAMKHSCTRNNKVVPLPTQPDLDPSYPVDPQPARVDPQPASVDPQPASLDPQPASVDPQPASVDPQPARVDPQPARVDPQPARVDPQPACVDPQPARVDPQPARVDPQPARVDPQPARVDPQPARVDPQPACVDPQPDPQPACVDPQPARVDPQPARVDPQPARVDPQPAPEDQAEDRPEWKKKKKGVRARFKKGWQAMKHSCTRNNKVVPLPTQPDLDPSYPVDPQPAPVDPQPAPVDPQPAPVDPQPAPVDPQPAPVDPQPAPVDPQPAPEDPQPGNPKPYCPYSFDFTELIEEFYRSLSDYDPYVQRLLRIFPPYDPPRFPATWYSDQEFLLELEKFEAFSALYDLGKNCLGKGHRGIVYQGTRKSDGLKVAIKFMSKLTHWDRFLHVPGYEEPLIAEVAVNLMLQKPESCPNIVDLLDWFEEDILYILVLEYPYPCLSLKNFLEVERLSEDQARPLMRQAVNAAQHCIDHDVCHGSLATRNIVINIQTMTLMFIDFGRGHLASTWGKPDSEHPEPVHGIPAPTWVEPSGESWGRGHAVAHMVSSLGKLLLCMMGGYWASLEDTSVTRDSPELTRLGLTEECLDLINRSGIASPPDRPTLEEFLDHEWFKQGSRSKEDGCLTRVCSS